MSAAFSTRSCSRASGTGQAAPAGSAATPCLHQEGGEGSAGVWTGAKVGLGTLHRPVALPRRACTRREGGAIKGKGRCIMRGWCGSELVGECARACSTAAEGAQGFKGVDIGLNTEARVAAQIYLQQHSTSASM